MLNWAGFIPTTPPPEKSTDNTHFRAVVEQISKRIKVRIFIQGAEQVVLKWVSAKRLNKQIELQV